MKKGFTIIELLIVIAIIAILATMVIINVSGARARANYTKVLADMKEISNATKVYAISHNGVYPVEVNSGLPTEFQTEGLINTWPTPPTSDFVYKYINNTTSGAVGVYYQATSRAPLYYHDIKNFADYAIKATFDPKPLDITTLSVKKITGKEDVPTPTTP